MNIKYAIRPHLLNYQRASYVAEEAVAEPAGGWLDCAYGVNPYGYSERVGKIGELRMNELTQYPKYPYCETRRTIAAFWREVAELNVDCIRMGCGSMGILTTINKMFIANRSTVLGYAPQFTEYVSEVKCLGGRYEAVPLQRERNFRFDCEGILRALNPAQRLLYLDNPNNPTGQVIALPEIEAIVKRAAAVGCCVIVDEAYGDFMDKRNSAIRLTETADNLFVVRSFSKGFGLAGLRLGYLVCSRSLLPYYKKVEMPFAVSDIGCRVVETALADTAFIEESVRKIRAAKRRLMNNCQKLTIWHTHDDVPILVIEHPDPCVDLQRLFLTHGVLTESGNDFMGLGQQAVRLRIPTNSEALLRVMETLEANW